MRAARWICAALAIVACAWFVFGIRQAIDTSRATTIANQGNHATAAQEREVRSLVDGARLLNPDRQPAVLLGQTESTQINVEDIQARLNRPEYAPVAQSLREIGFHSAVDLFSTYAGQRSDLEGWLKDAMINRDRNLRLQYLAGMGLNLYQSATIYSNMLAYSRFPEKLFIGSDALKQSLREAIQRAQGR